MRTPVVRWMPGAILTLGAAFSLGLAPQRELELRAELGATVPTTLLGYHGEDMVVPDEEARVAGFDDYLLRSYQAPDGTEAFTVYVGFYGSQTRGHTIHSPKNCLPGSGWEALESSAAELATTDGRTVTVNRYILQRGDTRALVLYWYQGRGRVAHSEYGVKFDLLRDAALHRRSDEALVRVVVPVTGSVEDAFGTAARVAGALVPAVDQAVPQ